MATSTQIQSGARRRYQAILVLAALGLAGLLLSVSTRGPAVVHDDDLEGRAPTPEELRPSVEAAFPL